ncbi:MULTISPECIES: hypothetical protein [Shewanella]|uniref:hypothetical protein n=1 Tax=Shewanella TaxID=22 RepID=UPI002167DCF3|nr:MULTISPECIES: hypothetical protein [Shewanella]MCS6116136.1 hypothetical protein [Shewanella baltica]MCS6160858.1 hypothetical protein [Shewanella baltica]MCU8001247.1 hypothetical protein [Shewanella sp. SM95]UVW62811.1 hypothetical protein HHE93_04145 [Shewanella baltica]
MFDEAQKEAVMQAYNFACKVAKKHHKELAKKASNEEMEILNELRSEHLPEELKKRVFDLAVEYHYCKSPSSKDGLITNLKNIETELKSLITKFDTLKSTAPHTFDDIASQMYSPYLRGGELKAQEFTYYDPQTELKHLVRSIRLAKSTTHAKAKKVKKRGTYWHRIEQLWLQITNQRTQPAQNSDFIVFSEMIFNSGKSSEGPIESAEALSKDYRRYLNEKLSASLLPSRLDKNE